jgi:hypothetical protein
LPRGTLGRSGGVPILWRDTLSAPCRGQTRWSYSFHIGADSASHARDFTRSPSRGLGALFGACQLMAYHGKLPGPQKRLSIRRAIADSTATQRNRGSPACVKGPSLWTQQPRARPFISSSLEHGLAWRAIPATSLGTDSHRSIPLPRATIQHAVPSPYMRRVLTPVATHVLAVTTP